MLRRHPIDRRPSPHSSLRRLPGVAASLLLCVAFSGCAALHRGSHCVDGTCGPGVGKSDCSACQGSGCGQCLDAAKRCLHDKLTCGSGCGSLVLDEWFDNPPDCCDPCDNWGGWTGNRVCPPKCVSCETGCSSCLPGKSPNVFGKHALGKNGVVLHGVEGTVIEQVDANTQMMQSGPNTAAPRATNPATRNPDPGASPAAQPNDSPPSNNATALRGRRRLFQ